MSTNKVDNKAARAAAIEAIDFNAVQARALLNAMTAAKSDGDASATAKDEASIAFCQLAGETVSVNLTAGVTCRDTITRGFCKHMDALMPSLAAEGSPFVTVTVAEGKDTRYSWKGHGANVKSIAKGVTEFYGVQHDDEDAIIDVAAAESFTAIKQSVQIARQWGESDADRELREAKELYRNTEAKIRKIVLGMDTAEQILEAIEQLDAVADDLDLISPELVTDTSEADADAIAEAA